MVATKAVLAKFFFLGFLNLVGLFRKDPITSVGRAFSNKSVIKMVTHISEDFSLRANYEKGNVERLLVDGYAILLEETKLGYPEKIITGKKLEYIKNLTGGIMLSMRPEGLLDHPEDPTEEIY